MTLEKLEYYFKYDRQQGKLIWKNHWAANKKKFIGKEAGSLSIASDGYFYRSIKIEGKQHRTHRLIFFIETGIYPDMVDHVDGNTLNNKYENLSESNQHRNARNQVCHRKNPNRLKGCYFNKRENKWKARIEVKTKRYNLGTFNTESQAHLAYCQAMEKFKVE